MTGSEYTVASAGQLVGSLIAKRREAHQNNTERYKPITHADGEKSSLKRVEDVKCVRFASQVIVVDSNDEQTCPMEILPPQMSQDVGNSTLCIDTEKELPCRHQYRIAQTKATLGASRTNPIVQHLLENGGKKLRLHVPEIYFSPMDIGVSTSDLFSPAPSPTQTSKLREGSIVTPINTKLDTPGGGKSETNKEQYTLTEAQMDQLVVAFTRCPLVQRHVHRQWWDWDDMPDNITVSDISTITTPSLTSASTLYSLPNEPFLEEHTPVIQMYSGFECNSESHTGAQATAELSATSNLEYSGVILSDPKIHGSPIRYASKKYQLGTNTLKVGHCSFLNIPYGATAECVLRVEPPSRFNPRCRVVLQVVNQMVERKSGVKGNLVTVEFDMTQSFTEATLVELAAATGTSVNEIEIVSSPQQRESDKPEEEVDWIALADELQSRSEVADAIDNAIFAFTRLNDETSSQQTLNLLASLDHIKDQYADFLILRPRDFHDNGMPVAIGVPWISQRLYHRWSEDTRSAQYTDLARDFRVRLVVEVAKQANSQEKIVTELPWGHGMQKVVECVPLFGYGEGRPEVWVCVLQG